ncbi:hypothetical protein DFH29DRAFT_1003365 [Suillus ampliporus]|nr:hypothetical protein DFH29DRAFT_1003365 [Suillus ampliporus]
MRKEYYSQYSPVDGVYDDDAKLLGSGIATTSPPKSRSLHWWPWLSHGVLMFIMMLFFTLWARAPLIDDMVLYSPATEAIESIGIVRFNGSFGATSIYRGIPSKELDAAWDRISLDAFSSAPNSYPDEYGGGYMATVEVIHQLHCIDMLRRVGWGDHYYHRDDIHESPEEFRTHVDHCIEMLRQLTMCRGDVTMITNDWIEGSDDPFPEFDVPHQCRSFEKILDWVDEHRVSLPKSMNRVVRLKDNVNLPSPP